MPPRSQDLQQWAGKSNGWRYLAQRQNGSGTPGPFVATELPLADVSITKVLSGPVQIRGKLSRAFPGVVNNIGEPLITEWDTMILAESNGQLAVPAAFVVGSGFEEDYQNIDATGFTTGLKGLEYPNSISFSDVDPLDIVRHIWQVAQTDPALKINVNVDPVTHTDVRVGGPVVAAAAATSTTGTNTNTSGTTDEKPFEMNWWTTHDLGAVVDGLASDAPFAYMERSAWNADKTDVVNYLDFGYPTLGYRRPYLRFVLGENIFRPLAPAREGDFYANDVVVLGAGEGSQSIRGRARKMDGKIHRMVTLSDKKITDPAHAQRVASLELARRQQITQIDNVLVKNSNIAPFGSFDVGDEIRVQGTTDWMGLDVWCRILSMTINPDVTDMFGLSIMRTDWY